MNVALVLGNPVTTDTGKRMKKNKGSRQIVNQSQKLDEGEVKLWGEG
jgi:RNase H-fold protein (predicted Holliday junction resolvase)